MHDADAIGQHGGLGQFRRVAALPDGRPPGLDLVRFGWLVEEYRVSLWAQQLTTREPVSDARLRKAMQQG